MNQPNGLLTFQDLIAYLNDHDNYLLIGHADPDGDALGAVYSLCRGLIKQGKRAEILNADRGSEKYTFFDSEGLIQSLEDGAPAPSDLKEKIILIIDTSDLGNTGKSSEVLIPFAREIVIIDHHTPPAQLEAPAYINSSSAATCQIIFEILKALQIPLDKPMAEAIFTGIVYDTGSFIYPKTTPRTFAIASELTQLGVVPKEVHSQLYETIAPNRMRLLAKVQATLALESQDRIAIQDLYQTMLKETDSTVDDSENFINYPLKCTSVLISVLLKEVEPGIFRCSMRSKGNIDISSIAQKYGGGGHKTAAGFLCPPGALAQFKTSLLQFLETLLHTGV